MNNRGFIATSLIYSFFIIFIAMLAVILNNYLSNNKILKTYNSEVERSLNKSITNDLTPFDWRQLIENPFEPQPPFFDDIHVDSAVFSTTDDYGTSYYFRGQILNNYIKFANKIWRILRINGNGTLRIVYTGISGKLSSSIFYSSNNTNIVRYNHSLDPEKPLRTTLDAWYENYIMDYGSALDQDTIFCNDLNALERLENGEPTLICAKESDKFSVSNSNLTYPIGTISVDEVVFAGGAITNDNPTYYLKINNPYWTMSKPTNNLPCQAISVDTNGKIITTTTCNNNIKVLPVVNLSVEYVKTLRGSGTQDDPYIGELDR